MARYRRSTVRGNSSCSRNRSQHSRSRVTITLQNMSRKVSSDGLSKMAQKELNSLVNLLENPSSFGCGVFWWGKTCGLLMDRVRIDIKLVDRLRSLQLESAQTFPSKHWSVCYVLLTGFGESYLDLVRPMDAEWLRLLGSSERRSETTLSACSIAKSSFNRCSCSLDWD